MVEKDRPQGVARRSAALRREGGEGPVIGGAAGEEFLDEGGDVGSAAGEANDVAVAAVPGDGADDGGGQALTPAAGEVGAGGKSSEVGGPVQLDAADQVVGGVVAKHAIERGRV